jgi:HlyD family secretion protein
MRRIVKVVTLSALVAMLVLCGCSNAGNGDATESGTASPTASEKIPVENTPRPTSTPNAAAGPIVPPTVVVASGFVRPSKWVELGFQTGGLVAEVVVAAGDQVEADQLLAQLHPGGLDHAVTQAEEALAIAKARLDQAQAGARPEELAVAEARVAQAVAKVSEAELGVEETRASFNEAEASVEAAKAAVQKGETEAEVNEAEAKVDEAEAQLEAVRAKVMAAHANVDAARAQRDQEVAQRDLLKAGARVEDITILGAQVKQAEAALARAQSDLEKTKLTAPFAGTVVAMEVQPGETVSQGGVAVVLANLDTLQVHTEDLDQLSVVKIKPGQEVRVSPDALPGLQLSGRVVSVPLRGVSRGEEMFFPVIIELVDQDPDLRWGMTAIVEIIAAP